MMDINDRLDTIAAMLRQEFSYQPPGIEQNPTSERFSAVGIDSRGRMLTFYYDLLEKIGSSRETAEIALSYLDRFLACPEFGSQALRNKKLFQLTCTTCLYVSVKIHELQAITPNLLADLSQGIFTAQEIEEMELVLARKLQWRLNPPTSLAFVREYLELLPLTDDVKFVAYDLAEHQTEVALDDPRLFCERKSIVAYMAVQNALERLQANVDLSDTVGRLLLPEEQMTSYHFNNLQSLLRMSLSSQWGYPAPPPTSPSRKVCSFFTPVRTNSPSPPGSHYVSPRSVNNRIEP